MQLLSRSHQVTDDVSDVVYRPFVDYYDSAPFPRIGYRCESDYGQCFLFLASIDGGIGVFCGADVTRAVLLRLYPEVPADVWAEGPMVGYRVASGSVLYLNPTSGSDDGVSNVFAYQGAGNPDTDQSLHFYDLDLPTISGPRFVEPVHPAGLPAQEPDSAPLPSPSPVVATCTVYAHQSSIGDHVLNVEIDAPAGVTVRVQLNDGRLAEMTVRE